MKLLLSQKFRGLYDVLFAKENIGLITFILVELQLFIIHSRFSCLAGFLAAA